MINYAKNYYCAYTEALELYTNQRPRTGFETTFFSRFRHSYKKYPQLVILERRLLQCKDPEEATIVIKNHFMSRKSRFNYHSFNSYFLDVLAKFQKEGNLPQVDWQRYNPHRIHFYNGTLFRGDPQPPETVFAQGFHHRGIINIKNCIANYTGSIGISTSTQFDVAYHYAFHVTSFGDCTTLTSGYVYKIDYQGLYGIEIPSTLKQQGHFISYFFARSKHEVNIAEHIAPQFIVGAWDYTQGQNGKWISNANYYQNHALKKTKTVPAIMCTLA